MNDRPESNGRGYRPYVEWVVRRNPAYLLSAACMAVGARLYLVNPSAAAGDVGLILLTLGVLQLYELLIGGILITLYRSGRSPEDRPSLLLIGALFWTGPLAATMEMTAHQPEPGLYVTIGAGMIAIGELVAIRRVVRLRLSPAGLAVGICTTILLLSLPPFLRESVDARGANDLYLYCGGWVIAAIALLGLLSMRRHLPRAGSPANDRVALRDCRREMLFVAITLSAGTAHLVGMNHAFFSHGRLFYACPLMIAVSVLITEGMYRTGRPNVPLWIASMGLPFVALLASTQTFHPDVAVEFLPGWLHDPFPVTLLLCGIAWWFGFLRHRVSVLMHAGNAAIAYAAYTVCAPLLQPTISGSAVPDAAAASMPSMLSNILFAVTGYFATMSIVRRSRFEAVAALGTGFVAICMTVDGSNLESVVRTLAGGWAVLIAAHVTWRRPHWLGTVIPVLFLAIASWRYDFAPSTQTVARMHVFGLMLILLLAWLILRETRDRLLGLAIGTGSLVLYAGRAVRAGADPWAAAAVAVAFLLLVAGGLISWYKRVLLVPRVPAADDVTPDISSPMEAE